jgi:hypothetical protein
MCRGFAQNLHFFRVLGHFGRIDAQWTRSNSKVAGFDFERVMRSAAPLSSVSAKCCFFATPLRSLTKPLQNRYAPVEIPDYLACVV